MGAGGSETNQLLRDTVTDQGVRRDIDLFNFARDEAGLLITGSTSPVSVMSSNYLMHRWAASNVDAMQFKIKIPREAAYKTSKKYLTTSVTDLPFLNFQFHAALRSGGTTDSPRVTCLGILRAPDGAQKGTFTPTSPEMAAEVATGVILTDGTCAALPTGGSTNAKVRTWNFFEIFATGPLYAAPGDSLDLWLIPGTHGTDTVELQQAWMSIAMNPCYTDPALTRE